MSMYKKNLILQLEIKITVGLIDVHSWWNMDKKLVCSMQLEIETTPLSPDSYFISCCFATLGLTSVSETTRKPPLVKA